jgi:lysophospholipase L1-like esterase
VSISNKPLDDGCTWSNQATALFSSERTNCEHTKPRTRAVQGAHCRTIQGLAALSWVKAAQNLASRRWLRPGLTRVIGPAGAFFASAAVLLSVQLLAACGGGADSSNQTPAATCPAGPARAPDATSRSQRIAAFASGPLVAGIPWRADESVAADDVRRIGSGHHLVYTTAGTTGDTEPALNTSTVLDGRPIADGTAIAYLNGRVLSSTTAGAPIVSWAVDAAAVGLLTTPFAAGDSLPPLYPKVQGCRSISIGTSYIGHYCFANGPAGGSGNATAFATGPFSAGLSDSYVYHTNSWEEEFVITDHHFGLVFANSTSPINVEIDGVQVQAGLTSSSGTEGWTLSFDYQGVAKRRTVRVVSATGSVTPALRGVALTAQGSVEAGASSNDQVLILGDSINTTVTPSTEAGAQMLSYWVQRYLGFGGAINMAVGGSGYVSQNPNSYNVPNLLANPVNQSLITAYAPHISHVIIGAGFNDRMGPLAEVQAAALASWKALRTLLPDAKISITDGWSGSSGPDSEALALAAALASTFASWGDCNSRLIRSVGGSTATAYVNGTGNAGTPLTAGNSSVYTSTDAVHPSPAGARHLARRLSDDISSAWASAY